MNKTALMIAAAEARHAIQALPAGSDLPTRFRAACGATREHWMVKNEDERFRAAVGGLMLTAGDDEKPRIEHELRVLRSLHALMAGVPVDFGAMVNDENAPEPIGLIRMWDECKKWNAK